ncbi:MAG: carboxypeptidase M32, partial [bacterium]|nr:carboxypeptidase M32 [bacterium]
MPTLGIDELKQKLGEVIDVRSAIALLHWDQETYMPPKAGPGRGRQLATLSAIAHRMFTAPEIGDALRALAEQGGDLSADDAALVDEALFDYTMATKLPDTFVQRFAEEQSKAFEVWVKAREAADFAQFRPNLETLVDLLREKADLIGY